MKKLFTLFASAALLAGAANAEVKTAEIEMNFRNWSTGENMAEPQTTTISYEDGVYTINEFMNSTRTIQFTLNADTYTTDGEKNYCVEIPSEYFDGSYLLPGGSYYRTYLYGYNGTEAEEKTTVNYIQGYPTSSYIKAWSPEEYDTPIYFCFCMKLWCGSETSDWMYFDFYMPDLGDILVPKRAANEQEITMTVEDYYSYAKFADDVTSLLTYANGEYTIKDFVGTGCDLTFTVPAPQDLTTSWGTGIAFVEKDNTYLEGNDAYFVVDTEEEYPFFTLNTDEGEKLFSDPYIYGGKYSKVSYNAETDMYSISLLWTGWDEEADNWMPYLGSEFSFQSMYEEPVVPGDEPVSENIYIDFYNDTDDSWLGGEETTVTYKDGTYYIDNFMNTGLSLPIILSDDESAYGLNEWNYDAKFGTENLYDYYGSGMPYLYNYETGKYATGTLGEQAATSIYVAEGYIYVMKVDPEEYGYDLYVDLWASAYLDDVWTGFYVDFYMNDLAGIFNETAVETVETSNAPAEYYNLQGVRVMNPEKGLYIMRQGNKAVKVMK